MVKIDLEISDIWNIYSCSKCGVLLDRNKFNKKLEYDCIHYNYICPVCKFKINFTDFIK